ncbi:MAG: S8 family serine peptidase [Candidatus Neomarinimicrobiota bacterium]
MYYFRYHLYVLLIINILFGQEIVQDRIIVKIAPDLSRADFIASIDTSKYAIEKVLVKRLNIVSLKLKNDMIGLPLKAVKEFQSSPYIDKVMPDTKVSRRNIPDDNQFDQQWALHNTGQSGGTIDADIDAIEAWDISTGGVTPLGDTIVVAIVDGGMLLTHNDLIPNLWTNYGEIPGNGIDDDDNGYIDDIHGWNAYSSNGSIPSDGHGTHVAGIVGAKGNNGDYVSGVNWDVKLMALGGSSGTTSIVLEAYGYILDQRAIYDSTGGTSGAFVVATNSSFGVNNADCNSATYSLWNDMYNALGEYGILSCGATMNNNSNVDVTGDVPTGCNSDYMISVTNTTRNDSKNSGAAYGLTTIDLGAPGTQILSTYTGGGTSSLSGTSMASPQVAGAIGLIHSSMSSGLASLFRASPDQGAMIIKQIILEGTDQLSSLNGITVSGGRLNLYNSAVLSMEYLAADSLDPNPITNLTADTSEWYRVNLQWNDPTELFGGDPIPNFMIDIYKDEEFEASVWSGVESYTDNGLSANTEYNYSLITRVIDTDSLSIGVSISVTPIGGNCQPSDVNEDNIVNILDVIELLRFSLGYYNPTDLDYCKADLNYDNVLDIIDVLMLMDVILGV